MDTVPSPAPPTQAQATLAQIEALVRDRAECDVTARRIWNIIRKTRQENER